MSPSPKVSVLMTAYNAAPYIKQAIKSILSQSFKDFELIIINDGSSDDTLKVIKSFKDKRIRLISRPRKGRHYSLEEGINEARGRYLAIMDSDDISMPQRLEEQVSYLDSHPGGAIVSARIKLIDQSGDALPDWPADRDNVTPEQIRACMPYENCIANPATTGRTEIFKKFRYNKRQIAEDYDLWLRLLSAGYSIHKIDKVLLSYRIHSESITQTSNSRSVNRKILSTKIIFLQNQLMHLRFREVERDVLKSFLKLFILLLMNKGLFLVGKYFRAVRKINQSIVSRLSLQIKRLLRIGYLLSIVGLPRLRSNEKRVLFIVPIMALGGAEKVMLDIMTGFHERGVETYLISTVPHTNEWRRKFAQNCTKAIDIGSVINEKKRGIFISLFIRWKKIDNIVTSNNLAGYQAAEIIKESANKSIKIIDIIHGQGGKDEMGGWPALSLPYDRFLDRRVTVTEYIRDHLINLSINKNKITVIHNGIRLSMPTPKPANEFGKLKGKFIVLWAGRFSTEKHPELAIETCRILAKHNSDIHFILAGSGYLKESLKKLVKEYRLDKSITISADAYSDPLEFMAYSDVLLMTSEMEGLPLVIIEAFSCALPVIAPRVGGIPEIVKDGINGYLISFNDSLPKKASDKIQDLFETRIKVERMGELGKEMAMREFSADRMVDNYMSVLGLEHHVRH